MIVAFDTDVLIYAAQSDHEQGRLVRALLERRDADVRRVGSVLLLPEVLSKPQRAAWHEDVSVLAVLLGGLDLLACDRETALMATALGSTYKLKAADAVHLATAIQVGADAFVTNNRRDFPKYFPEVDIWYPEDLADSAL